ncbi:MAG TPA: MSHA biogenesis protein MshI [Cellvibrio sp.]|nr:MSHA biogenesis protein MshI [Cellvibrio sp.]
MQQINLYLPEFQPNREPLRSIHMLWGAAAFIVILVVMSLVSAQQNRTRIEEVALSRVQLDQLKAQVAQLEAQRPKSNLAELDAESLKLKQELVRREQIFNVIANKDLGNNSGFSSYLQALGRQSLDTLSLEAFSLTAGGNYVELAGKSNSVDQVPLYIQRLRTEVAFTQSAFGVLNAEPQKEAGVFEFSVTKQDAAQSERSKTAVQMLLELNAQAESAAESQGDN